VGKIKFCFLKLIAPSYSRTLGNPVGIVADSRAAHVMQFSGRPVQLRLFIAHAVHSAPQEHRRWRKWSTWCERAPRREPWSQGLAEVQQKEHEFKRLICLRGQGETCSCILGHTASRAVSPPPSASRGPSILCGGSGGPRGCSRRSGSACWQLKKRLIQRSYL